MNEPKQKFALKIAPEVLNMVEKNYKEDGCGCRSAFIEKAILFYCGYLTAEDYREYFPNAIVSTTANVRRRCEEDQRHDFSC